MVVYSLQCPVTKMVGLVCDDHGDDAVPVGVCLKMKSMHASKKVYMTRTRAKIYALADD